MLRIGCACTYVSLASAFVIQRPSIRLLPRCSRRGCLQVFSSATEGSLPSQSADSLLEGLITSSLTKVEANRRDFVVDAALPGISLNEISDPVLRRMLHRLHDEKRALPKGGVANFKNGSNELLPPPTATGCELISLSNSSLVLSEPDMAPPLVVLFQDAFQAVVDSFARYGFHTELSPFDLFHGHLFQSSVRIPQAASGKNTTAKTLGLLFHCYEYLAADSTQILRNVTSLGYCQTNSTCYPTLEEWRYRNVLWLAWWSNQKPWSQAMWLLDGNSSIVENLRVDASSFGPDCPNTVWEGWFGKCIGEIYNVHGDLFWVQNLDRIEIPMSLAR